MAAYPGPLKHVVDGHEVTTDPVEAARMLADDAIVGFDTETTGLNPWTDHIATVQLYGDKTGTAALIRTPGGVIPPPILDVLQSGKLLIAHNGVAFDMQFLHTHGVDINKARWYDTLVAETAIVPTNRRNVSKSLRASAKRRLGTEVKKDVEHGGWDLEVLSEEQVQYAMHDVLVLPALRQSQLDKAAESGVSAGLQFEMDLVPAVAWLTINGMPISRPKLEEFLAQQVADIAPVTNKFRAEFGDLNPRSPKQLLAVFVERGVPLTDTKKETLQDLSLMGGRAGELADIIMGYRRPDQRLKVYGGDWFDRHTQPDGRVHPRFWQCATDTTRFSSSGPNAEQIPRDMRYVFGWEEGMSMVSIDLSQIEIRVAAKLANDRALMAILEDEDVHASIAADAMFHVPKEEVTFDMRKLAKAVSFTLLFGGGAMKLYDYARRSGGQITEEQAYGIVSNFFTRYEGLKDMKDKATYVARTQRVVTVKVPSGLKRMLVGSQVKPTTILNTMVQSSAAAGIKFGLLEAWHRGLVVGRLCNQVHDELVACTKANEAKEYAEELRDALLVGFRRAVDCNPKAAVKINVFWEK